MKKLILYLFTVCVGLLQTVSAQTVTGTVTGADDGQPLPGVNIMIKGTSQGTITDLNGNYTIDVSGEDAVLVFSYVGFLPQEQTVGSKKTIDVVLEVDAKGIDEVVVVGYGTQKRSEVTGAITSIDSEEITALPVATAEDALQGRAAGVTVVSGGAPGNPPTVRIRGLSTVNNMDPLYVIDGVVTGGMGNLNPNDIESIQILKDASTAAIYGSLGANGVVMITTKKGTAGKVKIDFDAYYGTQWNNNRYDVLNSEQYQEYSAAFGTPAVYANPPLNRINDAETNWQDNIYQHGMIQNYNLGISGGNENSSFMVSAGYVGQEGIIINTGYDRFNFRANSNFKLGKFKFGENLALSFSKRNPEQSSGGRSLLEHAIKMAPYLYPYNAYNLGGFQGPSSPVDGQDAENPVRIMKLNSIDIATTSIIGNIYGEFEIIDGLTFKSLVGLDRTFVVNDQFLPSFVDDQISGTHQRNYASVIKNTSTSTSLIYTNSLNYKKTFADKHNLELLGVIEYATSDYAGTNTSSRDYISDVVEQVSNQDATLSSTSNKYRRIGYLGRLNYNFDSKYLIAASIRKDASSRFGKDNRWGTFPSVALGWKVSNEAFMENVSAISNLKIRGSWGKAGNDKIGDYKYSSTLTTDMNYVINDSRVIGATQAGRSNPALKWEETAMTNIGFDLGLLDDQFTLSAEYFKNTSDDLLMARFLPPSMGDWIGAITSNVGSVETTGFELQAGYNDFEGEFQWSAALNFSTAKSEVKDLGGLGSISIGQFEGESITRLQEGEPLFYFYGWQFDGIFQNDTEIANHAGGTQDALPGDFRIVDTNGDNVINAEDRTKIGNPFPKFTLGLNLTASYKGFDLSAFIQGVYGNDVYNTNIYDLEGMPRLFNAGVGVMNRWTGPGTSNTVPRALGSPTNTQVSSRFVEDGSYTRLKNITLGYTLPADLLGKVASSVRVYVSATNIITITDYSGLDPEIGARLIDGATGQGFTSTGYPVNNFQNGIDYGNYPIPKSFIAGIQIKF